MKHFRHEIHRRLPVVIVLALIIIASPACLASIQLGAPELQSWSDMAFTLGVKGSFNTSTKLLTASGYSNDLEIGGEFGPGGMFRHYGTGGTLGLAFSAKLELSGVIVESDGTVSNGGTLNIVLKGSAPGSIGDDYGIGIGAVLLSGNVVAVKLDATGLGTLDVLFAISGGALQDTMNPYLGTNFAPGRLGLMRFDGRTDTSTGYSLDNARLDVFGDVPEFQYATLLCFCTIFGYFIRMR